MSESKNTNRLINEKSLYLLQHARNPVDWYPWSDEAFQKAEHEDRPVFLSIGYSTCHWCHVMERESFEDPEVAALMNDVFISIKVDREERPDIDNIYMNVCQMMTGGGGWPLTIVMTPDKKPFFAGTYFPKVSRYGRIGMLELIPNVKKAWQEKREQIENSAEQIINHLYQMNQSEQGRELGEEILITACNQLAQRFDAEFGGFGEAPKFPSPHNLTFLLRCWKRFNNSKALNMVEKTLTEMRKGGIYDHIGFGFHRYSTDKHWLLPHFEKMLYDQAMLCIAYIETYQVTKKKEYADTAGEIFEYVLRDMTSPEGGFYSAEDADSEGEEGKFYVWTYEELKNILDEESLEIFTAEFNIHPEGNFHDESTGQNNGKNIPHITESKILLAEKHGVGGEEFKNKINRIKQSLYATRNKRVHPLKDDKILTDWNGLMIAALAKGARVLKNARYSGAAERAINFILDKMKTDDGKLLHRYRDGEAGLNANLDDYAFVIWALLELYETTFKAEHLKTALEMNEIVMNHFRDDKAGGFFFTSDESEKLLIRKKESYDGAIPSGNSIQMMNLLKLGRITADPRYERTAYLSFKYFSGNVQNSPSAFCQMLSGVDFALGPSSEIIICGQRNAEDTQTMLDQIALEYLPNKIILLIDSGEKKENIGTLAEYTANYEMINNSVTAYVCSNYVCKVPTNNVSEMIELIQQN